MLCSEIQLVKAGDGYVEIKPLPCNRWSCDYCAPRRRFQLVALATAGEPNKILTLTVNPAQGNNPTDRRAMLHDAWKKLVKRILRKHKWAALPYMAFLERTKAGEPHLHILLRCPFISQRWLSQQMKELIGAPIVWIEKINSTKHAVRYVTKYVSKAPAQFGNGKRYWVSRGWELRKVEREERPIFDPITTRVVRERWEETLFQHPREGYEHKILDDGWHRFKSTRVRMQRHHEFIPRWGTGYILKPEAG